MWNETSFAQLLDIKYPIIQAPMAGSATVELAAAVKTLEHGRSK
jgi:nitronate monooxygenase